MARDLGLEVVEDYEVVLPSGLRLEVPVFVPNFGGKRGMLVVSQYATVKPHVEELARAGFGFSTLDAPREDEEYVRQDYVEMLKDWGWSGSHLARPPWVDEESR